MEVTEFFLDFLFCQPRVACYNFIDKIMAPIIDRILSLLTSSQGNLLYSLVLVITVFGAFQASMYADGRQATPTGKRMQQGLLYLLLAQGVLFLITWLVALGA